MKVKRVQGLVLVSMQMLLITACQTVESPPSPKSYAAPPNYFAQFAGPWIGTGDMYLGKEIRPGAFAQQITIYQLKIASSGEATLTTTDASGTHTKALGRLSPLNELTAVDGPATSSGGEVFWITYELKGNQLVRQQHGPYGKRRPFIYKRLQ